VMKIERPTELSGENWQKLSDQWMTIDIGNKEERGWTILKQPGDIGPAEQLLLRRTGKAQDGFVSRYINRPISRFMTRGLLKFPITPSGCTLSMLAVPFIAFLFLIRGDYAGFVAGTALFQIYNIFDGCDGEIARAKYLESEKGRRLDASCDLVATLIFVLCLGFGLFRQAATTSAGSLYLLESITACFLEIVRMARYAGELVSLDTSRPVSQRQEKIVLDTSQRLFGKAGATFLFQITKRDVAFFAFLLLAISGMPSLILHFFFLYAVVTLLLALRDFGRPSSGRG
jgi:phosphatidylglycerophosphate synthase